MSELKHSVWEDERVRKMGIRKGEIKIIVDVVIEKIVEGLFIYGCVKLKGLFTLEIRRAKGRRITNPQTGKEMHSKDYNKIGIIPSEKVKSGLKNFE